MRNAAMLWTGGKDSAMALFEAERNECAVRCLVTFAPPKPTFLAHPLAFIELQAQALELPHHLLSVTEPFERAYEVGLSRLRDEMGCDCVLTGDIAEVDGHPNWIRERSAPVGMHVQTPLWGRDRATLLRQLLHRGFRACFSCVDTRWLNEDWVGRELDEPAIAELRALRERTGLDLCGEEGEYHTLVTDGPPFRRAIDIRTFSRRRTDSHAHLQIDEMALINR